MPTVDTDREGTIEYFSDSCYFLCKHTICTYWTCYLAQKRHRTIKTWNYLIASMRYVNLPMASSMIMTHVRHDNDVTFSHWTPVFLKSSQLPVFIGFPRECFSYRQQGDTSASLDSSSVNTRSGIMLSRFCFTMCAVAEWSQVSSQAVVEARERQRYSLTKHVAYSHIFHNART